MADTPVTPTPPAPPAAPSLWQRLKGQVTDLWDRDKGIFLLIAVAAVIVKFRDIFLDMLINSAKRVDTNAKKEDAGLATQEDQAKQAADAAVAQAAADAPKDGTVTDDWYKNDN